MGRTRCVIGTMASLERWHHVFGQQFEISQHSVMGDEAAGVELGHHAVQLNVSMELG